MTISSRLPGLFVVALVIVVSALLIAGYGVPVGIGMLIGLLIGAVIGLLAVVPLLQGWLSGRSGSGAWSTFGTGGMGIVHRQVVPDLALMQRHAGGWQRVASIDAGELRRVMPVGITAEAGGVRIELVALEIRDSGVIATLSAETRPPVGPLGHFVDASVADDQGTTYIAAGQANGSSGPDRARLDLRFAPAPPTAARRLTIVIEAFVDPTPRRGLEPQSGPWQFLVSLPEA